MCLGDACDSVRGSRVSLAAVVKSAMWLDVRDGDHGRKAGNLVGDQGFDLGRREGRFHTPEPLVIVIARVRAHLDSQLPAAQRGGDCDRDRPRVRSTGDVGAVNAAQDCLIRACALTEIGVEVQLPRGQ